MSEDSKIEQIRKELDADIPRDKVATREGNKGRMLSYLEGWQVIDRLNKVLGQGNWSYITDEPKLLHAGIMKDRYGAEIHTVHYSARVVLQVPALGPFVAFADIGYGDGTDKGNPGKAHELALKESVTDGLKRCAKNLGMSLGLALYDKSQEHVSEVDGETTKNQPAVTAGSVKPVAINQPKSVASVDRTPSAPEKAPEGISQPPKAPTRESINASITREATIIDRKRLKNMAELKEAMKTSYGTDDKSKLTDEQAEAFLSHLRTLLKEAE